MKFEAMSLKQDVFMRLPHPTIVEIAIRGIEINSKEYFIQCFLKKELIKPFKRKFALIAI